MGSSTTSVVLETGFITLIRGLLFHACQRFLLRSIFHDLRSLAPAHASATSENGYIALSTTDLELEALPPPSTASSSPAGHATRHGNSLHSTIARASFSLCFSESCMLFLLVMCQGLGLLNSRSREVNWKISIFLLLAIILLVIPLSQNILLSSQASAGSHSVSIKYFIRSPTRIVLTIFPYTVYVLLLSYVPLPAQLSSSQYTDLLSVSLSRLVVLGTVVLGILSGFGVISNAWDYLPFLSRSGTSGPSDQDVLLAEQSLMRVQNDLIERKREQERLANSVPKSSASWWTAVLPSFRGTAELSALSHEIKGLSALEYQMDRNLEVLKQRRAQVQFNATFKGTVLMIAGRIFSVYCVFRILSSIINIIVPRTSSSTTNANSYPDLITHVLAYFVSLLPSLHLSSEDIAALSRAVSLGLVGVIILSSLRAMLWRIGRLLRFTSRSLGASLMLLILAQLMGMYLLSTLVQLRTAFPLPPSSDSAADGASLNLFSTLPEFEVFGALFDWTFLLSAFATLAARWFDEKVNGVAV